MNPPVTPLSQLALPVLKENTGLQTHTLQYLSPTVTQRARTKSSVISRLTEWLVLREIFVMKVSLFVLNFLFLYFICAHTPHNAKYNSGPLHHARAPVDFHLGRPEL